MIDRLLYKMMIRINCNSLGAELVVRYGDVDGLPSKWPFRGVKTAGVRHSLYCTYISLFIYLFHLFTQLLLQWEYQKILEKGFLIIKPSIIVLFLQ
jgi:hypothetical protein